MKRPLPRHALMMGGVLVLTLAGCGEDSGDTGSGPVIAAPAAVTLAGTAATGAVARGVHLWARDAAGRAHANFYAAYGLVLP